MEASLRGKAIYFEVRNFHDFQFLRPAYEKSGWRYLPYLNVLLPLEGKSPREVLAGMKYNRRRELKLAQQYGAAGRLAQSEEEVRELYRILVELYRERVKVPLPQVDYFLSLYRSSTGKVFVVEHEQRLIGGAFCLCLEGQGIYTKYYCGIRDYHPKIISTHLAVWAAVEYGLQCGAKRLDFMGAGLKDREYGVRTYKMQFGGELVEHGRFVKMLDPWLYQIGKTGLSIMRKLGR
jgi:lipid II:glycine glycyltransferase (peptidoglycan interpeptide bridge formation enzyme)